MKPLGNHFRAWMLGLAAVAILAGLGWWAAESRAKVADAEMREQLLQQTEQIVSNINVELVRKLSFTASDEGKPEFECLREQLAGYGNAVPNASWLYCMSKRDDRIIFGIDIPLGGAEKANRPAKPGDIYEAPSAGFLRNFGPKQPFTDGPCSDAWGTFVSACVPVTDPQTGKFMMLVGLDVGAGPWNAQLNAARRAPLLVTMALMLVLGGGVLVIRRRNRHKTTESLKLKAWIVVPTALAAMAAIVIFGTYQYKRNAEDSRRNMLRFAEHTRADGARYLKSKVQLLKEHIDQIARNPEMLKAWQERDLATLNALGQPCFKELTQKHKITHFYFLAPDRTCFLRVHQPERRGDLIDRSTLLTAMRTGEDAWGTEMGAPNSSCTLRYVSPWKRNGKVLGYLELGIEVGNFVNQLAQDMDADIVTVLRKEYTSQPSFEAGKKLFGYVGKWGDYADYVVAHQTSSNLSNAVMHWLANRDASPTKIEVFDANQDKRRFACGLIPLLDSSGRNVADLIVVRDVTMQSEAAASDLLWSLGLASALICGILALLWSVTGAAEKQLSDAFAEVRYSRERFAQVAETNGEVIWEVDAQGLYTYASQACRMLLGYDKNELVGKLHFYDLHPEEGREEFRRQAFAVFDRKEPFRDMQNPVVAKDGRVLMVLTNGVPVLNADGTLQRYRGSDRDITDLKQAEEALEKRIIALTRPLEDVGNIALEELFNLKDLQRLQDEFATATGVASIITHPNGTPITRPSNVCSLCFDIIRKTEKGCANCYKSDAVLGRYHSEGPVVQPCMSGGLWDAGAAITVGGQHVASWLVGQVRDETQTEEKMAEYARQIGADERAVIEAFRKVPSMSREKFEHIAKALFTLANQLSTAAYQNVQQARFITELKQAEEELLRAKAELQQYVTALELSNQALREVNHLAEAATRAKSEFLANMSHEIRTPMTAILGYADIMLEENVGRSTREHVEVIKRNGVHLLELINDILDLSKVEAGKMQIELSRCSPVELLNEVIALMRVRADAKHLNLAAELVGPIPETVLTDPLRLRQVLVNLVGNAIKFTDQGEVRIDARFIREQGSPRLCINIADTGIGMSQEELGRLFHTFTQVDSSAKRKFGGSGMGLCISKRLAEALGGTIEVRSVPGKGSTFTVTIDPGPLDGIHMLQEADGAFVRPLHDSTPAEDVKIELHHRILLAEDGPDNKRLICTLLKKSGAEVVAVENGQLAVEAALAEHKRGNPFDVVLMDMQMPVMDGYTATRQLREGGYTAPIIALTAHAMDQDRQKCLDAGCDDYATKPIEKQNLLATVARWTARQTDVLNSGASRVR